MTRFGKIIGTGVGPGDPELLTIKAYRALKEADVVAYPRKRKGAKSYAYQIIEPYENVIKEKIGLVFPMTKDKEVLEKEWNHIAFTLFEHAKQGKDIVFVTEGDPMLYSTFIHLWKTMKKHYPEVEVASIPGISSMTAIASTMMVPLADGDEWTAVVPATDNRASMKQALLDHDGVVFIKVAKVLPMIIDLLEELNLLDTAAVATKVTSRDEWIWKDVAELKTAELEYLTLLMVRKQKEGVLQ
ncbi:precorrin-2/cobalt-factor-2 C20-methyltransferase [Alteribacillus persepolensis]|uniref:Precorrin-2/cobalt-factor-2 C20-methyltransferase n=1 Tax=Alteribacillus persepolensis TaxID=568899 RepID=A0A1G7Z4X4_9BACI|nr:precorrin-2 C(20)-methyltransferase [Alteribacillus persepolensis]SDH03822.1 precorrin-2/cobalt-factor-2 C20-methyltransferase [Alteribacillus persepolensis]